MINRRLWTAFLVLFSFQALYAASDLAPAVPDLSLPAETAPVAAPAAPAPKPAAAKTAAAPKKSAAPRARAPSAKKAGVPPVTNAAAKVNAEEIVVENLMPQGVQTVALAQAVAPAQATPVAAPAGAVSMPAVAIPVGAADGFVPAREAAAPAAGNALQVSYNPPTDRDPTLSPDDRLLIRHREEERLRAQEAERQRKLEAERRRLAELERQRQLELERLRDPSREIRGKIRVNGIIGQEVFIGNKVYGVGKTVYGARIVQVLPDSVVFMYKGQKFTKKVQLQ